MDLPPTALGVMGIDLIAFDDGLAQVSKCAVDDLCDSPIVSGKKVIGRHFFQCDLVAQGHFQVEGLRQHGDALCLWGDRKGHASVVTQQRALDIGYRLAKQLKESQACLPGDIQSVDLLQGLVDLFGCFTNITHG